MTVSLQGLTSGQMYYCTAAGTDANSSSCGGPVVGGVEASQQVTLCCGHTLRGLYLLLVTHCTLVSADTRLSNSPLI